MAERETEIGAVIVEWLRKQDFEVFPEVSYANLGVADIVARRRRVICIVECKVSWGLHVMEQAIRWTDTAHYVYVATRRIYGGRRRSWDGRAARAVMERYGIGLLLVRPGWQERRHRLDPDVTEALRPHFKRRVRTERMHHILDCIPEDWGAEAGSQWAQQWTPFKQTCRDISDFVGKHPGCTLKEMLAELTTHYATPATARSVLPKWIDLGHIPDVFCDRSTRPMRLYPVDPELFATFRDAQRRYESVRRAAWNDRLAEPRKALDDALAEIKVARETMLAAGGGDR